MSRANLIASIIDASTPVNGQQLVPKPVTVTAPVRPVRVTEEQVKDATILAKQIDSLNQSVADATQAARSNPFQAPITFTGKACGTGGEKVLLAHNLDKVASFIVTGWSGNGVVNAPILVCDVSDAADVLTNNNTLALRSYVAGTATIMVF